MHHVLDSAYVLLQIAGFGLALLIIVTGAAFAVRMLRHKAGTRDVFANAPLNALGYGVIFFDDRERFSHANKIAHAYLPVLDDPHERPQHFKAFLDYLFDHAAQSDETLQNAIHRAAWRLPHAAFREVIMLPDERLCLVEAGKSDEGHCFFLLRDISEIRKDEEDVLRLNQYSFKLNEAIEAATNGIVIISPGDKDYPIVFANKAFGDYIGLDGEDVINSSAAAIMARLTSADQVDKIIASLTKATASSLEIEATGENESRWFSVRLTPVAQEDNAPSLFICVFTETTALKKQEAEIYQAQKLEALGKLSAGIAHDFNNILSIVEGYARMTTAQAQDNTVISDYMTKIHDATQRGSGLIRQMLAFGSRKITNTEVIDLITAMKKQEALVAPLIGAAVQFSLELEEEPAHIEFSKDSITQIMINLSINARDAMPDGGRLDVSVKMYRPGDLPAALQSQTEKEFVCLCVRDTGHGMDENTARNVFDPFFTTKDQGKGTGLGLSNVYGLMKQAGGHVEVQSVVGEGTTFKLFFPLTDKEPTRQISGDLNAPEDIKMKGYTALVAEDEPDLLNIIADMLEKMGMQVIKASNGNEALLKQEDHDGPIDLLLTDVVMPELNGVQLADLLLSLRPEVKVIFMSGYPADGALAEIDLPTDACFMAKPIAYENMTKMIFSLLMGGAKKDALDGQAVTYWRTDDQEEVA